MEGPLDLLHSSGPKEPPPPLSALVLVGGYGTRLRPLTLSIPKPLVPFCNKPMVVLQLEALVAVGVKKVVLAVAYKPAVMAKQLKKWLVNLDCEVIYSQETTPLGTAGPLALAREHLGAGGTPFFVLNADVTCLFPFKELMQFHRAHGKEGTIMVTRVQEPSRYGVVVGRIERFVEKPQTFVGNRINAGLYLFNASILNRIELKPTSIEREVFPAMASEHQLYAMDLPEFWMDIGQPSDYLVGLQLRLESLKAHNSADLYQKKEGDDFQVVQPVIIHPTAKVGHGCVIGPCVTIGEDCVIGEGNRLQHSAIFSGVTLHNSNWVHKSIIGWDSKIGSWCRVQNTSVLGEDVSVSDGLYLNGAKILPHKEIKDSVPEPAVLL